MAVIQATSHIRLTEAEESKIWTALYESGESYLMSFTQPDKILSPDDLITIAPHEAESPATLTVSPNKL